MSAIEPNWVELIVFSLTWFLVCVGFFFISGSLPVSAAPAAVRSGAGPMLIWANLALLIGLFVGVIGFGLVALRWTSLVVAGGFIFLFSPFVVQDLPARIRDTQVGLVLVLLVNGLALAALYASGAVVRVMRAMTG